VIERYGLLNIIVLGEVLLSISFIFSELYDGHFDSALVSAAVAGIVIVFCIWWLYFIEPDHLNSTQAHHVFLWGYGHIAIHCRHIDCCGLGRAYGCFDRAFKN
jgi:low temperature requirement protein LtrA